MTENVKHVEVLSGLFAIANANARDMSDGPVRDRERERSEALAAAIKWADQLQREAAGDGEGVTPEAIADFIHDKLLGFDTIYRSNEKLRIDLLMAARCMKRMFTAPRPTGTEYFSICSEHRPPQPDCRRCNPFATTPASAEPIPDPRTCTDCKYDTMYTLQCEKHATEARGGGEADDDQVIAAFRCAGMTIRSGATYSVQGQIAQLLNGFRKLSHPTPAALDAEDGFTLREITQALTQHYKNTTGDDRHAPATWMAAETVKALVHIIRVARATTGASE